MASPEALTCAQALRAELAQHNYSYYVLDVPTVSDAAYDVLMRELRDLELEFPDLVTPDSPTQRVGAAPAKGFAEVIHHSQMFSLANSFDDDEYMAVWCGARSGSWATRTSTLRASSRSMGSRCR